MRGYCIGGLVAFDKHWNFALVDVDEVYTRKRLRKAAPIADEKLNNQFTQLTCKDAEKNPRQICIKDIKSNDQPYSTTTCSGYRVSGKGDSNISKSKTKKPSRTESVGASVIRIDKIKRKTEVCRRHVPQLLIRGEHVASVVLM